MISVNNMIFLHRRELLMIHRYLIKDRLNSDLSFNDAGIHLHSIRYEDFYLCQRPETLMTDIREVHYL